MKKVAAVFAGIVFSLSMFSCTADSASQDDSVYDVQACDTCHTPGTTTKGTGS